MKFLVLVAVAVLGSAQSDARIVNGEEVPHGQFTPVVKLTIANDGGEITECTGTLVGPKTLLTAAHCSKGKKRSAYFDYNGERHVVQLKPSTYYSQADFDNDVPTSDVSLGVLDDEVTGPYASVGGQANEGASVKFLGYGETNGNGAPGILRIGQNVVKIARPGSLNIQIGGSEYNGSIGYRGDSGGPVFTTLPGQRLRITGVISWDSLKGKITVASRIDANEGLEFLKEFASKSKAKICGLNADCPEFANPYMTENLQSGSNSRVY